MFVFSLQCNVFFTGYDDFVGFFRSSPLKWLPDILGSKHELLHLEAGNRSCTQELYSWWSGHSNTRRALDYIYVIIPSRQQPGA